MIYLTVVSLCRLVILDQKGEMIVDTKRRFETLLPDQVQASESAYTICCHVLSDLIRQLSITQRLSGIKSVMSEAHGNNNHVQTSDLSFQKRFVASYPSKLKEFSVHLFYLNHYPGHAAEDFWKDIKASNENGER